MGPGSELVILVMHLVILINWTKLPREVLKRERSQEAIREELHKTKISFTTASVFFDHKKNSSLKKARTAGAILNGHLLFFTSSLSFHRLGYLNTNL